MHVSIPELLSDEHSLGIFLLVSVFMGGSAAWLAGRAIAATWRPWWHLALYMFPSLAPPRRYASRGYAKIRVTFPLFAG